MVGNRYGHLVVKEMLPNYKNKKTFCLCECDCGNEVIRQAYPLRKASTELTSCGCMKKEVMRRTFGKEIDGQRFGRLLVLETLWNEKRPKVKCRCDCGTIGIYNKNDVQTGHTTSCGCYNKERITETSTKDWTGFVSDCGVKAITPYKKNENGTWLWWFECPICHEEFVALPANINDNSTTSCGCKITSKGEKIIKHYMNSHNIRHIPQYTFADCRYTYKLKFDFAIIDENEQVIGLIEYDGKQHFEPIKWFGGEESYKLMVIRDNIKNNYCNDNKIPLLRLNYTQNTEQIEEELDKFLESVTTTGGTW